GDAVDEPLEDGRALAQVDEGGVGDLEVVGDEVELRPPRLGEVDLAGVGEPHLPSGGLDDRVVPPGHAEAKPSGAPPPGQGAGGSSDRSSAGGAGSASSSRLATIRNVAIRSWGRSASA